MNMFLSTVFAVLFYCPKKVMAYKSNLYFVLAMTYKPALAPGDTGYKNNSKERKTAWNFLKRFSVTTP